MTSTPSLSSQQSLNDLDFQMLLPDGKRQSLCQQLLAIPVAITQNQNDSTLLIIQHFKSQWQQLSSATNNVCQYEKYDCDYEKQEQQKVNWLIELFNALFAHQQVILVRGQAEPEYFPAQENSPARIEFAHGFFASALHEISHWCIAGKRRRQLPDFGYWYTADGRTQAQQQAFEKVEIKPQAIECLLTLACGRNFYVSQDNLFADFDTSDSTFAQDVYQQVQDYLAQPQLLPADAQYLLGVLLQVCQTY